MAVDGSLAADAAVEVLPAALGGEGRGVASFKEEYRLFFWMLRVEVSKVNAFYVKQLEKQRVVYNHVKAIADSITSGARQFKSARLKEAAERQLRTACRQLNYAVNLLKNFCGLNVTAIAKVLKKFDKCVNESNSPSFLAGSVDPLPFAKFHALTELTRMTLDLAALVYGSRDAALQDLSQKTQGYNDTDSFLLGTFVGTAAVLTLVCGLIALSGAARAALEARLSSSWVVFRFLGIPIFMLNVFAVDTYVWRLKNINYRFIFDFDPKTALPPMLFLKLAAGALAAYALFLFLSIASLSNAIELAVIGTALGPFYPLAAISAFAAFVFFPHPRRCFGAARMYFFKALLTTAVAPLREETFINFFLCDQFTSVARFFIDFPFVACYYATGAWRIHALVEHFQFDGDGVCDDSVLRIVQPLMALVPFWWRLVQCLGRAVRTRSWRLNLLNAGKYLSSISVILASFAYNTLGMTEFSYLWAATAAVSSMYSAAWDAKVDWGLFGRNAKRPLLRAEIAYPVWFYYFMLVMNPILRVSWLATFSPTSFGLGEVSREVLLTFVSVVEIIRRGLWNLIRVENEHINNCGEYRAVKFVPLSPNVN
jgi:xenotropic and polytropic retrovirus receptor 1